MLRKARRHLRACLVAVLPFGLPACVAPCDYGGGDTVAMVVRDGLPIVPVEVNGRRVPFVLDTGASRTTVFSESVAALGLPVDRLRSSSGLGIAGQSRERNALLARMRVGEHDLRNLTVPVATRSMPHRTGAVGLLGADLLGIGEVELDVSARRLTLHDGRRCRVAAVPWVGEYDTIPVTLVAGGLVVVPAEVNGMAVRALFDTGAMISALRRSMASAIGVTEEVLAGLPTATAHGIGTAGVELRLLRGVTVRVGAERIAGASVGLVDLPSSLPFEMILGQDYIGSRRFWLSYAERRLYVQRTGGRGVGGAAPTSAAARGITAGPAAEPAPAGR
ncbi:retroviral-like aspartic protease family protein [Pararoseomonas sp. SCSIO 73927]|uniref:retroviral-like aspartic protease family protein n=1 Tax=Pararoseomonas sp. SCSIO 73927 TaxID=3114537 RepID=UPI0030CF0389